MNQLTKHLKGDQYLWAFISLLALFSFLPVYSASTNLIALYGNETLFKHLFKHAFSLILGFMIVFLTQLIKCRFFAIVSPFMLPPIIFLLLMSLVQAYVLDKSTARWIDIPFIGVSFQPSTIAFPCLFIYCVRYLAKNKNKKISLRDSFIPLLTPIFIVVALILPSNGSSALMLFICVLFILFIGGYPLKNIFIILSSFIFVVSLFVIIALNIKNTSMHRAHTWKSRIERFFFLGKEKEESYQVKRAKAAIILGKTLGKGPGKSAFKSILPQSFSDFIYAIIIEEYGLIGGVILIFVYLLILLRFLIISTKLESYFESLLVLALGLPIILQAFINMGVAVNLLPVTGQTLPLISAGGTSMWVVCFSLGVILSASRSIKQEKKIDEANQIHP